MVDIVTHQRAQTLSRQVDGAAAYTSRDLKSDSLAILGSGPDWYCMEQRHCEPITAGLRPLVLPVPRPSLV